MDGCDHFRLHWSPLNADLTNANLTDVCNFSFPTNLTEKLIFIISAGFDFTFKQKSTIFWCKKMSLSDILKTVMTCTFYSIIDEK